MAYLPLDPPKMTHRPTLCGQNGPDGKKIAGIQGKIRAFRGKLIYQCAAKARIFSLVRMKHSFFKKVLHS